MCKFCFSEDKFLKFIIKFAHIDIMEKFTKNAPQKTAEQNKILSKPRIFFGVLFILTSITFTFSFISYLMNWKADQSQAGTMLDKSIKSSNLFGKIGDW